MAADNTLVQASFKEAISGAGADVPNLKPLYDSANTIGKSVFDVVDLFMDGYAKEKETQRVGKAKQMAGFQKQADELVAGLYAQDEPLPDAFMMAFRDKITSLQDEFEDFNTIGKGDTQENSMARARIMGELTRVKNQAINFRAKTQIFLEGFESVNTGEVDRKKIAAQQQALDFKNYGSENGLVATGKVEVNYGDNGIEITSRNYNAGSRRVRGPEDSVLGFVTENYSYGDDVVVSLESLNKNFPPINKEQLAEVMETFNTTVKQGTSDGKLGEKNYNEEIQLNRFVKHVGNPENFRNVVSSSIEGVSDTSFKESLQSNLQIPVAVLDNMFYDENGERVEVGEVFKDLNKVDDGIINEKDREGLSGQELEMFNQNVDALIDALTNVDNPAFDINKSSKMLGEYLQQNTKKRYDYNYGIAVKAGQETSVANVMVNNRLMSNEDFQANYGENTDFGRFLNGEGEVLRTPAGYNYERRNGIIYQRTDTGFDKQVTEDDIRSNDKLPGISKSKIVKKIVLPGDEAETVPYPKRSITSSNFDSNSDSSDKVLNDLEETYKDYPDFKFENRSSSLLITAPDGTEKYISMDRGGLRDFGGNDESRKQIQQFIIENQVKK